MRIWLVSSELPHEIAGGIARYVDNFARLAGAAGHEVVVFARSQEARDSEIAPNVRLIGIVPNSERLTDKTKSDDPARHPSYPYGMLGWWPALSYQMAEAVLQYANDLALPDIIESQEYAGLPYFLLQRRLTERTLLEQVPVLVHMHSAHFDLARVNQQPRYRFPDYWVGQMEKFSLLAADALLSPSRFNACSVKQALGRPLDVATIPLPLMIPAAIPVSDGQAGELLYVGRLEIRKGVLPLVKACSRMWEAGADFRLTLIGGDTDFLPRDTTVMSFLRRRYPRWIDSGRLNLPGQLDYAAVQERMRQAWAVLIPSLWENFPNTCIEAMAAGQVVLASRAGGQAEMIDNDGGNGVLFDWEVPGEFESKLSGVLALGSEERRRIGMRAQKRIQELCAPDTVLPQRIAHYQEVITRFEPRRVFPTLGVRPADTRNTVEPMILKSVQEPIQAGLLSVIVPYYNLGKYVDETLKSVLASTYVPLEVLVINDGSSDPQSISALDSIEQRRLQHVRVVHTPNQGLASARNTGVEAASGEFVVFVDADDLVEPTFFSRAVDVFQRYANVTFVYSWVRYFDAAAEIWPTWNAELPYMLGHNMLLPLAVVRRSAFLEVARNKPIFEYNFEDYESWLALVEAGGVGVSLASPLVHYRVRPDSMYRGCGRNQHLYLYDLLTDHHKDLYREWGVELFQLQNANGSSWLWNHPAREIAELSQTYVVELEQLRDKLWSEVQTLGKAWEQHVDYIKAQQKHIDNLESRCAELRIALHDTLDGTNNISPREYRLGGRLINRLRRTWPLRSILRYPKLKRTIKKVLTRF